MHFINVPDLGTVQLLDEFRAFTGEIRQVDVCPATILPSIIFRKIIEGGTVILTGEYRFADAVYRFCQHNENELMTAGEVLSPAYHAQAQRTKIKRQKLHRLLFAACRDELMFVNNAPDSAELQNWLEENTNEQPYLIPIRRYQRILTDMQRAKDGIYFKSLDFNIIIRPFVYVPADQSVPAMFLKFQYLIGGKRVLDVGTGTGILAIMAAKMNARMVTATDISPHAIACAKQNVKNLSLENVVIVCEPGMLFEPVKNNVFEIIMFNAPWLNGSPKSLYDYAIFDPDYHVINRFFDEASNFLTDDGYILLQYSDASQRKGDKGLENLKTSLHKNKYCIADQISLVRRSRVLGGMECVYLFKLVRANSKIEISDEG